MKERLTGAIILVVLIVLLVPELLSGPKSPSAPAPAGAASTSSEEPPLRSYTINLGDDSHSRTEAAGSNGPVMPQPSGPEQPTAQSAQPNASQPSGTPPNGAQPAEAARKPRALARTASRRPARHREPRSPPPRPLRAPQRPSARHGSTATAREAAAPAPPPTAHTTASTPSQPAPRVAKAPARNAAKPSLRRAKHFLEFGVRDRVGSAIGCIRKPRERRAAGPRRAGKGLQSVCVARHERESKTLQSAGWARSRPLSGAGTAGAAEGLGASGRNRGPAY